MFRFLSVLECHEDPYAYLRHKKTPRIAYVPWFKTYPTSWGSVTNATISNDTYRYNEVVSSRFIFKLAVSNLILSQKVFLENLTSSAAIINQTQCNLALGPKGAIRYLGINFFRID